MAQLPAPRSSPLALTVLALLHYQPLHPYGIQRLIKQWGKDQVVNVEQRTSLYRTIERLLAAGLITVTDSRTSGRTSAAMVPSARATSTTSYSLASPAITCATRGSLARAICSTRSSSFTLAVLSSVAIGSSP